MTTSFAFNFDVQEDGEEAVPPSSPPAEDDDDGSETRSYSVSAAKQKRKDGSSAIMDDDNRQKSEDEEEGGRLAPLSVITPDELSHLNADVHSYDDVPLVDNLPAGHLSKADPTPSVTTSTGPGVSPIVSLKRVRATFINKEEGEKRGGVTGEEDVVTDMNDDSKKIDISAAAGKPPPSSDLVSGVYEGGLKTWECSLDLCRYVIRNHAKMCGSRSILPSGESTATPRGVDILELGCGHGLPGITMFLQGPGANRVLFSDYNDYVLRLATWPNILENVINAGGKHSDLQGRVGMVAGDWMLLSERLLETARTDDATHGLQRREGDDTTSGPLPVHPPFGRFDVVLAAETTYTESASRDTATLLSRHLKHDTGIGLVATKRYYFGVGGGSDSFRSYVQELGDVVVATSTNDEKINAKGFKSCRLKVDVAEVYDDGASNIRELLMVRLIEV